MLLLIALSSCTEQILQPRNARDFFLSSLRIGGQLTYDETDLDSTVLPSSFADSAQSFKDAIINRQSTTFHVVVSVPDSNVPYFSITKTITTPSVLDTFMPAAYRVHQTVTYGTTSSEYDWDGGLIHTYTLGTPDSADLNSIPLLCTDTTSVTDSVRTAFVSMLTGAGQTVTTLSGGEISATASTPDSASTIGVCYFDRIHLGQDSVNIEIGGYPYFSTQMAYTVVGAYRIATGMVSTQYCKLTGDALSAIETMTAANGVDYSSLYSSKKIRIVNITNISLP